MKPIVETDSKHRMAIIHNLANFQTSSDKYIDIYGSLGYPKKGRTNIVLANNQR